MRRLTLSSGNFSLSLSLCLLLFLLLFPLQAILSPSLRLLPVYLLTMFTLLFLLFALSSEATDTSHLLKGTIDRNTFGSK